MPVGFIRPRAMGEPRTEKTGKTKRLVKLGVLGGGVILLGLMARAIMTPPEEKPKQPQPPKAPARRGSMGRRRSRSRQTAAPRQPKPPKAPAATPSQPQPQPEPAPKVEPQPADPEAARVAELVTATRAQRSAGTAAVPRLVAALKDEAAEVRAAAAETLGVSLPAYWKETKEFRPRTRKRVRGWDRALRAALLDGNAAAALAAACGDEDVPVREAARKALLNLYGFWLAPQSLYRDASVRAVTLGLVEEKKLAGPRADAFLRAVLTDRECPDRAAAARLLGRAGSDPALAIAVLFEGRKDEEAAVRAACGDALREAVLARPELVAKTPAAVPALLAGLEDEAQSELAGELLTAVVLARPEVVSDLAEEEPRRRALGFVGAKIRTRFVAALAPAVEKNIRAPRPEGRAEAPPDADPEWEKYAATLLRMAPPAAFALTPHLTDADALVRGRASDALLRMGPGALPALHEVFRKGESAPCAAAFRALRDLARGERHAEACASVSAAYREDEGTARAAAPAVAYLLGRLRSEDARVREDAAKVLALLGPAAGEAVAELTRVVQEDPAQRPGEGAAAGRPYRFVRAAAAEALGEVGARAQSAIRPLEEAMKDLGLRSAAYAALQKIRKAAAAAALAGETGEREAAWRVTLRDGKVLEASEVETYERVTGTMVKVVRTDGMVLHLRKDEVKVERITPGGREPAAAGEAAVALRLKDGRAYQGRLLEETSEKIVIEYVRGTMKMRMSFQKKDIASIARGSDPEPEKRE